MSIQKKSWEGWQGKPKPLFTVGVWNRQQWEKIWQEIAFLCEGVTEEDSRFERIQGYMEVFDQEYQFKDCAWFHWVMVRFRNGFPEKAGKI